MPGNRLASIRIASWIVFLASIGALVFVLILQFGFNLAPCPLCVDQRVAYGFAALFGLMAVVSAGDVRMAGLLLWVCALSFLCGAAVALFHVGVEQHWWQSACASGGNLAQSPMALLAQLGSGRQPVPCDAVTASLFGLSLASYNVLASLVLAGFAAFWAGKTMRQA